MKRIVYVGMDVHSTSFTFCALEAHLGEEDKVFGTVETAPGCDSVLKYLETLDLLSNLAAYVENCIFRKLRILSGRISYVDSGSEKIKSETA